MFNKIHKLPRKIKQMMMLLFDIVSVISCIFAAFYIRLGYLYFPSIDDNLFLLIILAPFLAIPTFIIFGLYRDVIRYVGFNSLWRIAQGSSVYAISWGLLTFMVNVSYMPRSVILINWLLVILFVGGSRLFIRWLLVENDKDYNVLIYGAGSAGRQLSNALNQSKEYNPLGFIDEASELYHHLINGLKVYSKNELKSLIHRYEIKEVLIAIPSISRAQRRQIIDFLEPFPVIVRALPGVSELAQGKVKVNDLLEIDLRELLGREPVKPNRSLLKTNIKDKAVMVTGAGGSIGSELCRQICYLEPKRLVLFDISESSLYIIEQELLNINALDIDIKPIIGSIADKERMEYICSLYSVNTIYHAAAYKHVPLVEFNPSQGLLNNAIGTMIAAKSAISSNVETFVLISSDKAVRPTNVMGASKRVAELILQGLNKIQDGTCFTMVRFGNVIDSSGSVIPLFKKQISQGGPITVTHLDVVRYFMSIPEAVELVIQAGAMGKGGEVFVLDMGEPIRIYDLAKKLVQLSGLTILDEENPNGDIEIKYTGLRPGEKLYEELLLSGSFSETINKLIKRAEEDMIDWEELEPKLTELNKTIKNINLKSDKEKIYLLLSKIVSEFKPKSNISSSKSN
jgi:FlaA1/EpsC-like NDP-sugar epimerase